MAYRTITCSSDSKQGERKTGKILDCFSVSHCLWFSSYSSKSLREGWWGKPLSTYWQMGRWCLNLEESSPDWLVSPVSNYTEELWGVTDFYSQIPGFIGIWWWMMMNDDEWDSHISFCHRSCKPSYTYLTWFLKNIKLKKFI